MTDTPIELEERIAAARKNIRALIDQMTLHSAAEALNAEILFPEQIHHIRERYLVLAALLKQRDAKNHRPVTLPQADARAS
jgi:hypothetical protein